MNTVVKSWYILAKIWQKKSWIKSEQDRFKRWVLYKIGKYHIISNTHFTIVLKGPFYRQSSLPHWCSDNENSANLGTRQTTKYSERVSSNQTASQFSSLNTTVKRNDTELRQAAQHPVFCYVRNQRFGIGKP